MKFLLLTRSQYGYQTDYQQYARALVPFGSVVYSGVEAGRKTITDSGIEFFSATLKGSILRKVFQFLAFGRKVVHACTPDVILVHYWPGSFLFTFWLWPYRKRMILDIRTGAVGHGCCAEYLLNRLLAFNTLFFPQVSCISRTLIRRLGLNRKKTFWLPLGASPVLGPEKTFERLSLLYVGTFRHRKLDVMLSGFKIFFDKMKMLDTIPISFTIVGDGAPGELEMLKQWCEAHELGKVVSFLGYQPATRRDEFLKQANIGIAFVPLLPCYDAQPPTKTFEYLMAGMPVVATDTSENRSVVTPANGVLCQDHAPDFAAALERVYRNRETFHSEAIRKSVAEFSWARIVEEKLLPKIREV